jgi:hypothetical protein
MRGRFGLAVALAFAPLLLAQPAFAWDTTSGHVVDGAVQFDFRGGSAAQTLQVADNSTLTITVNNTIANCIGTCTPIPDTWSLTINGERWDGNSIEVVTIQTVVSGEVLIQATGKDEGFWGGWYGPIFSAPIVTEPVVETGTWEGQLFSAIAPAGEVFTAVTGWYGAPTDASCGADVSAVLATLLGSNTFEVSADNGVFGDPCGGVVKVLRVNLVSGTGQPTPVETPQTPEPSPTESTTPLPAPSIEPVAPVQPPVSQPEPSPVPVVPPVVAPPVVEPAPQPQPIPLPEPEPAPPAPEPAPPAPVPTPEATPEPKPIVAPEPPVEAPKPVVPEIKLDLKTVDPETISPVQQAVITQEAFAVLETAVQGSPAYEQALEALAVVAEADDPELPAELAAIPLLGNVAGAVMDTFNAVGNIGADISPKERKKGQQVVVGTVIVGQMASVALLRR